MRRLRRSLLLASMLAAAPLSLTLPSPAAAQVSVDISFDSFHGQLANYGDWLYSDRWGEVWRPDSQDRDGNWRPYWAGHWVDTDEYGWTWISDEGPWGDIAYHYGRWVNDPDDGWLWLPGYVWSPAWVVWRSSADDVGWMPMPPDDDFLRPSGVSIGVSFGDWNDIGGYYGYSRWYGPDFDENRFGNLWVFVPGGRLSDPGYRRYELARPQTINIVRQSRNITNYTVVNNIIINRSANVNVVRGPQGRPPQTVRANTVLRSTRFIAPVNQGEQIQQRARQERPHGNGIAGSAPQPTQQQIQSLSTRAIPVRTQNSAPGNAPAGNPNSPPANRGSHLFNRNTVTQFAARQQAQPNGQPAQAQQPGPPQQPGNRGRRNGPQTPGAAAPNNPTPAERGPQAGPQAGPPAPGAAPPNNATPPERNRGFERPQQQQTPQAVPERPVPTPPQQQDRGNRTDRNFQRTQPQPQAAPERPAPPAPLPQRPVMEQRAAPPPPPPEDRGNRADRNFQRGPAATEQRPDVQRPEPQRPERAAPPPPPQRPAMEQRAAPPQAPQRPAEARPNPPANAPAERKPPPDRGQDRGEQRDNRNNDNNR